MNVPEILAVADELVRPTNGLSGLQDIPFSVRYISALAARLRAAVPPIPEGWKLVPVEATQEMLPEAWRIINARIGGVDHAELRRIWRAMLAAVPPMDKATLGNESASEAIARAYATRAARTPEPRDEREADDWFAWIHRINSCCTLYFHDPREVRRDGEVFKVYLRPAEPPMSMREAFEAYYRRELPDADFSAPMWKVEWAIWQAALASRPTSEPVAWRVRGYNQFKTGTPGEWRFFDGPDKPRVNDPDCCDMEPLCVASRPTSEPVGWQDVADRLFAKIAHGDDKHREWLRNELNAFFAASRPTGGKS